MIPVYPAMAGAAALGVVVWELRFARTGLFRDRAYWVTMVICLGFMVGVDGWLTKASAPVFTYRASDTSRLHPVWNILLEEFVYAFALLTLVMVGWDRSRRRPPRPESPADGPAPP